MAPFRKHRVPYRGGGQVRRPRILSDCNCIPILSPRIAQPNSTYPRNFKPTYPNSIATPDRVRRHSRAVSSRQTPPKLPASPQPENQHPKASAPEQPAASLTNEHEASAPPTKNNAFEPLLNKHQTLATAFKPLKRKRDPEEDLDTAHHRILDIAQRGWSEHEREALARALRQKYSHLPMSTFVILITVTIMAGWHFFRSYGEMRIRRKNKRAKHSHDVPLAWVDDETKNQVWQACMELFAIFRSAHTIVEGCPSDHDFLLSTIMAEWHDHGGVACNPVSNVNQPSFLFLDAINTSMDMIKNLYSDSFLESLQMRFPNPSGELHYGTNPTDTAKLRSTMALLLVRTLPSVCQRLLDLPNFPTDTVRSIANDVNAILDNRAMPSLTREVTDPPFYQTVFTALQQRGQQLWDALVKPGTPDSPALPMQLLSPHTSQDAYMTPPPTHPTARVKSSFRTVAADHVSGFLGEDRTAQRQIASSLKSQKATARQKRLAGARSTKRLSSGPHDSNPTPPRRRSGSGSGSRGSSCSPTPAQHLTLSQYTHYVQSTKSSQDRIGSFVSDFGNDSELDISAKLGVQLQLKEDQEQADVWAEKERIRREAELQARRAEEERRRKEEERIRLTGGLRAPRRDFVPELREEWVDKAEATPHAAGGTVLATAPGRIKLTSKDFKTLVPETEWLNDEIVNGALAYLDQFVNEKAGVKDPKKQTRKCIAFSSFFYPTLKRDVGSTGRQLSRLGINKDNFLAIDTMLIPVCEGSHWTLLVVRPMLRLVSHLDSLSGQGNAAYRDLVMRWIQAVLGDKWNANEWKQVPCVSPRQPNSWDCGMHTIMNGICVALGLLPEASYSTRDVTMLRLHIAAILLNGGFKGEFDLSGL